MHSEFFLDYIFFLFLTCCDWEVDTIEHFCNRQIVLSDSESHRDRQIVNTIRATERNGFDGMIQWSGFMENRQETMGLSGNFFPLNQSIDEDCPSVRF